MTMDLCRGHMEHISTSGCSKLHATLKGNMITMICAPVEHNLWRTAAVMMTGGMVITEPE
jgi:hypothetical protein